MFKKLINIVILEQHICRGKFPFLQQTKTVVVFKTFSFFLFVPVLTGRRHHPAHGPSPCHRFQLGKHHFEVFHFDKRSRRCQRRSRRVSPRQRGGQAVSGDHPHDTSGPSGRTLSTHHDNEDQYLCRKVN
jgi:hypothetical protein